MHACGVTQSWKIVLGGEGGLGAVPPAGVQTAESLGLRGSEGKALQEAGVLVHSV